MRQRMRQWVVAMAGAVRAAFVVQERKGRAIATRRRAKHVGRERSSPAK